MKSVPVSRGRPSSNSLNTPDAAICRSGVKITSESLRGEHLPAAIARAGVGVDNIDLKAATRHGSL